MAYFECVIGSGSGGAIVLTVTCADAYAGSTITCTDGATTLTATCPSSSPYTVDFTLTNSGTWTISGTVSGDTNTETVIVPSTATLNPPIPTGSTKTPTDDIQTWLHCANIWDKAYTTISQVLSDGTTVTALISSNNAVDYMVRSTTWASSVVANSSAMTKIGANNYCSDALLNDSTWRTSICNSTYFESVLNVKVPTLTATDSYVIADPYTLSGYPAWYAFANTSNGAVQSWASAITANDNYIGYDFNTNVKVYKLYMQNRNEGTSSRVIKTFKIQGYDTSWVDVTNAINNSGGNVAAAESTYALSLKNNNKYKKFRLFVTDYYDSGYVGLWKLQFYGRKDV